MSLDSESLERLRKGLAGWQRRAPALAGLPEALAGHAASFQVLVAEDRLELACREPVRGRPNRGRLLLTPVADEDLTAVFYRVGADDGRSRYGYGGLAVVGGNLRPDQVATWLDYLATGFEPSRAPRGLRPQFQYPAPSRAPGGGDRP